MDTSPTYFLRPLLCRSPLQPGESLASLVVRLARLNFFSNPAFLTRLCIPLDGKGYLPTFALSHINRPPYWAQLAVLSGLPIEELAAASSQHFRTVLSFPSGAKDSLFRRFWVYQSPSAQFCPVCLQESAYHRLIWGPVAVVSFCLKHHCLLEMNCPHCQEPVTLRAVVDGICHDCLGQLSQAIPQMVEIDPLGWQAQQTLQHWFLEGTNLTRSPEYALPPHSPPILYRVMEGLCLCLAVCKTDWPRLPPPLDNLHLVLAGERIVTCLRYLSPRVRYYLFRAAFAALLDWPRGFETFLAAFHQRNAQAAKAAGLDRAFRTLYTTWIQRAWKFEEFNFVYQVFERYLFSANPYLLVTFLSYANYGFGVREEELNRTQYMTQSSAAWFLNVGVKTLERLIQQGQLREMAPGARYRLFLRQDVLAVAEVWKNGLSLVETCVYLGASSELILELNKRGWMSAIRGPHIDESAAWLFARSSLDAFWSELTAKIKPSRRCPPSQAIGLPQAARMLAKFGLKAIDLVELVLAGKLPVYGIRTQEAAQTHFPIRLSFSEVELQAFGEQFRLDNKWMTQDEIACRMGVKSTVVARWINSGLLTPVAGCAGARYFDQSAVETFAAEHVFSEEAAKILRVGQLVVQKWARSGRLKPVASEKINGCHRYLFRRSDLERLRPENRLTAPQLAKKLGLSRTQLGAWIRQGKVKPISGPGVDGSKHYLFEADAATAIQPPRPERGE